MIARIWHGRTDVENYEDYSAFLKANAIPDYELTPGFIKLIFLRRKEKEEAHFTLITFWENMEVIKNFTVDDIEKAKYYSQDHRFLLEFEEKVVHYEVFADSSSPDDIPAD